MNVKQDERVIVTDSEVVEKIMALSDKNLWGFEVLGQVSPITEPVFFDGFRCDLIENEEGNIPGTVWKRHKAVKEIALVVQELILHEVAERDSLLGFAPPVTKPRPQPQPIAVPQKQISLGDFVLPVLAVGAALTVGLINLLLYTIMVDPASVCVVLDEHGRYWWVKTCWWPE